MTITFSSRIQRARGAFLGLAIGDALGTTVEFEPRDSFEPLTDIVGGGPFGLLPGQFTDDTSMALCLGASLLAKGFDLNDQMGRYVRWYEDGYMSSNGVCFDIGLATRTALRAFEEKGNPEAGSLNPHSAGNGCLMRLVPVPIYWMDDACMAVEYSDKQARGTHQAPECISASRLFGEILVRALQGQTKRQVLEAPVWTGILEDKIHSIGQGKYKKKRRGQIKGSGYVVQSLEATLWCFFHTDSFKDCVLMAANLGDDADTTAAQAGQLAGAFYGEEGIPPSWLDKLTMRDEIARMAEALAKARGA